MLGRQRCGLVGTSEVALALVASVASMACAGEPLVFPEWTITPPEGTRVVEHAGVPETERDGIVELERDLMLGGEADENYAFYNVVLFDLDADGNIYVLDGGNFRVMVYDNEGRFVRRFGREGQGPGEFVRPRGLAVAGDHVIVEDASLRRLSIFDRDGNLLGNNPLATEGTFLEGDAIPGGDIVALKQEMVSRGIFAPARLVRVSQEGTVVHSYALAPWTNRQRATELGTRPLGVADASPSFGVDGEGNVYFSAGEHYEVLSFTPDGAARWALRVAHDMPPYSEEMIDAALRTARLNRPDATLGEHYLPEAQPALSAIAVDGHGHLWVFPWVYPANWLGNDPPEHRPVDVYGPDGERLFAGWINGTINYGWRRAQGDYVYLQEPHPDNDEITIVRYRLVEPF